MVLPTIALTFLIVTLAVAGIGVKVIFKKNGEFAGTCATNNPMLTNEIGECTVCGKKPEEEECKQDDSIATSL